MKLSYDEKCEELAEHFTRGEEYAGIPTDELAQAIQECVESFIQNYDPTPWCGICGARKQANCDCPPPADNE